MGRGIWRRMRGGGREGDRERRTPAERAEMRAWIDDLTRTLGEQPITPEEIRTVLRLARGVAQGVERRLAPVSTYVAGLHVARRTGEGASREDALRSLMDAARRLVPETIPPGHQGGP